MLRRAVVTVALASLLLQSSLKVGTTRLASSVNTAKDMPIVRCGQE